MSPMKPMEPMIAPERRWPEELGEKQRLAVDTCDGKVHVYDTGTIVSPGCNNIKAAADER